MPNSPIEANPSESTFFEDDRPYNRLDWAGSGDDVPEPPVQEELIEISWSEFDALRQCPFKHQLAYIEGWEGEATQRGLLIGTLWHAVMEDHYSWVMANPGKVLMPSDASSHLAHRLPVYKHIRPWIRTPDGDQGEYQHIVDWMYRGYLEHYGTDPEWEILGVEEQATMPVPHPNGGISRFVIRGKLDLRIMDRRLDTQYLVDHKSGKNLPRRHDHELHDQFSIYAGLMQRQGLDLYGTIHSAARTGKNKVKITPLEDRFRRTPAFREPEEIKVMLEDLYWTFARAYGTDGHGTWARDGDAPRWTDAEMCVRKCQFTEPCLAGRRGTIPTRDMLVDLGFQRKPEERWDYYDRKIPSNTPF